MSIVILWKVSNTWHGGINSRSNFAFDVSRSLSTCFSNKNCELFMRNQPLQFPIKISTCRSKIKTRLAPSTRKGCPPNNQPFTSFLFFLASRFRGFTFCNCLNLISYKLNGSLIMLYLPLFCISIISQS